MNLRSLSITLFLTFLSTISSLQAAAPAWLSNTSEQNTKFEELTCVTAMGDGGFCAVQKNGMLYLSKDGHKWEERNNSGSTNLLCADFYDRNNGVVAGVNTFSYTTSGGDNWNHVDLSMTVRSVSMPAADKAVFVGDGGTIYVYKSGTLTKVKTPRSNTNNLTSVDFYGATGYACGSNGTLLRSEDYGQTWESLEWEEGSVTMDWVKATDPTNSHTAQLNGICAVDARTAYAVGNGGVMLKTIDGGDTWSRRETSTTEDLTSMTVKPDGNLSVTAAGHVLTVKDGTDLYSVRYYYDRLGRLVASQNSKQHAMQPQRYSYTLYDALGRNVEAGELESDVEPTDAMINDTETRFPDNWSKKRYQVTRSVYDGSIGNVATLFSNKTQENLRGRIATTLYQEVYHSDVTQYDHATHYSYDIHGNVKELIHELPELDDQNHCKRISYDYDLVSGKVNQLDYQKGKPDGYSLRYEYDGENRIVKAYANYGDKDESGSETWHELANYEYYRHGPLARTVLGGNLQSVDYAYTLQGWTKGVNLDAESDATVKSDVYGYELQYNNEDYKPISSDNYRTVDAGATNLYNGNITAMSTNLKSPAGVTGDFGKQTRTFSYDELNRLTGSQVVGSSKYATSYTYDANGNITALNRNDQSGSAMDQLTYHYATDSKGNIISNRLLHVNDGVKNAGGTDIKDQGAYAQTKRSTHNYEYDEIGNLIKDKSEEIAEIRWNVTGKVTDVIRTSVSTKPDLHFAYDAMGQRIAKTVINKQETENDKYVTTYYVRDPQGNVLAVYERKRGETGNGTFTLTEQHLYGAGRLGMRKRDLALNVANASETPATYYELTNHLGNVMAVISDKASTTAEPTVVSLSDYYPYGMEMPKRAYNLNYRFGYTGHEKESDFASSVYVTQDRLLDTRLGRWLSVDPMWEKYPISSYNYCLGNPIIMLDLYGGEPTTWNRVTGGLQMLGGVTEMVGSGFGEVFSGGTATPLAFLLFANGVDNYTTGFKQLWTGEQQQTVLYSAARDVTKLAGASDEKADNIAMTVDMASSFANPSKATSSMITRGANTTSSMIARGANTTAKLKKLCGNWVKIKHNMNTSAAAKYQQQISGKSAKLVRGTTYEFEEYLLNGTHFDGLVDGVLVEAKHGYGQFLEKTGEWMSWWEKSSTGLKGMLAEANRQVIAAEGNPIKWFFDDKAAADAMRKLFIKENINIEVVFKELTK